MDSDPSDFISVPTATGYTTWMDITSTGTYYLFCKDTNGTISTWASTTYQWYTLTFDPDGLAEDIFNKENTELEDVDLERIETYYSSLAGNTTCKQSKE